MNQARAGAACATLPDGRVLAMGGNDGTGALATAEIFDPVKQTWTQTGSLAAAREGHRAVLTGWGAVWVAGGTNASGIVGTVEEYVPSLQGFVPAGTLQTPRTSFAMAALPHRRILIAGGTDANSRTLNSVEIFDAMLGQTWVSGTMTQARQDFAAAPLPDGTVLISGGLDINGSLLNSTEIFDPAQGVSTAGPNLLAPRANHSAYALPENGAVMIMGGTGDSGVLSSTETYAPWTGAIQASSSMTLSRRDYVSAVLLPGTLLVAGGRNETGPLAGSDRFEYVTIGADRPDYAPGTPVKISGAGWEPGERVSVQIAASPVDRHRIEFTAAGTADSAGNVTITGFTVDRSHLGVSYIVTAAGRRFRAESTFASALTAGIAFAFTPVSGAAAPGSSVTVLATVTSPQGDPVPGGVIIPCLNDNCNLANATTPVAPCTVAPNQPNTQEYGLITGASSSTCSFTIPAIPAGITKIGVEYLDTTFTYNPQPSAINDTNYSADTPTTTAMTGGPSGNTPYGDTAAYTASVTTQGSAATGQAQFLVNGSAAYNGGAAAIPLSGLTGTAPNYMASWVPIPPLNAGGAYLITAQYNANNADTVNTASASANSVSTTIASANTTTAASFSANPIVYGQPLTIGGNVAAVVGGGVPGSGSVTIAGITGGCNGTGSFTVNLGSNGTFSCIVTAPGPAVSGSPYAVTATYTASGPGYNASSAAIVGGAMLTVNQAGVTTSTPAVTVAAGAIFTFSADLAIQAPSSATANLGTTFFYSYSALNAAIQIGCAGGTPLTPAGIQVNGSGSYSSGPVTLANGNYTICATSAGPGGGNFAVSTSNGLNVTSPAASIADTVGAPTYSPSNLAAFAQSVTISAIVTDTGAGSAPTPGTLTFNDAANSGAQIGTAQTVTAGPSPNQATASVTVSNLSGGAHNITATYVSANSAYASPTTSLSSDLTIAAIAAPFSVTSNSIAPNQNVVVTTPETFVAAYTGAATPPPQGNITFTNGANTLCSNVPLATANGVTSAGCTATAGSAGLPVGAASVTAVFTGTGTNYSQGAITTLNFAVVKASDSMSISASPNPATAGQTVALVATVTVPGYPGIVPGGTVAFSLGGNAPPAGNNTCGSPVPVSNHAGVYTATCSFELIGPGGQITYSATYNGDSQTLSSSGNTSLTANKITTTTSLTATAGGSVVTSAAVGQTLVLTATLSGVVANVTPSGGFAFTQSAGNAALSVTPANCIGAGSTPVPLTASNGNYIASCQFGFSGTTAANITYTATYASTDLNYNPSSATDTLGSSSTVTTTALTASIGASSATAETVGQLVTLTATVASASQNPNPSGTVTFTLGGNVGAGPSTCGSAAPLNQATGVATCQFEFAGPGASSLSYSATYSGDSSFLTSNKTILLTTNKAPTLASVSVSPAAAQLGSVVTLTAIITGNPPLNAGSVNPATAFTGSFAFGLFTTGSGGAASDSTCGSAVTVALVSGNYQATCSFEIVSGAPAAYIFSAAYGGDNNFLPSSTGATQTPLTTQKANPGTLALTLLPSTLVSGELLSITVTAPPSGSPALLPWPTGCVSFTGNGVNTQLALSNGTVTLATGANMAALNAGSYAITATYNPICNGNTDPNYVGIANSIAFTIGKAATTTAVTSVNNAALVTVAASAPGSGTPTGTATIYAGASAAGTPVASGPLTNGSYALTLPEGGYIAVYSGDQNFFASASLPASIAAQSPATTITLDSSTYSPVANQPVTLSATINSTGVAATPTGIVTFTDNGVAIGTATLAGGHASITVTLPIGANPIVATFGGASAIISLTVGKPASTVTFSSSPTSAVYGQAVTLTAGITTLAGVAAPTGTAQFFDGATPIGTAPLIGGVATLSIANLAAGVHTITVAYSGDSNYGPFSGAGGSITINKAQISATVKTNTNNGQETLTVTAAAVAPGSGTPTGTVQFLDTVTGKAVGTATLAEGMASITIPVTTDPITAMCSGDSNFNSSAVPDILAIAAVSGASWVVDYASDEIVTVFGTALTTQPLSAGLPLPTSLGGVSVTVTDSVGTIRTAALFYVSATQISFLIPAGTAIGTGMIAVTTASGTFTNTIAVTSSAPGLFTANANGLGPLSAQVLSVTRGGVQTYSNTAVLSGTAYVNAPIVFTPAADSFYLLLYGTGFDDGKVVTVTINGQTYTPVYSGPQGTFAGLDQIDLLLPATLAGSGAVSVTITVDGAVSNAGTISFQ